METIVDIRRKAKAWDILYDSISNDGNFMSSLCKEMDRILEKLTPIYHPWEWALANLLDGKRLRWRDWGDSYIMLNGERILRYSVVNDRVMEMGVYGISSKSILTEAGWCLYGEDE